MNLVYFNHMQRLSIRTFSLNSRRLAAMDITSNPQNLPKLPVPPLQKTLEKFLKTTKPHLTAEEYDNTRKAIDDFAKNGTGHKLQSLLEKRAAVKRNWLEEWWLNVAYLEYRLPLLVYSNPGLVLPFQSFKNRDEQISYVSKIVRRILLFKNAIYSGEIPTDKIGKDDLDMCQYKKIFGTCRVPNPKRDILSLNESNHFIVIHNGHIFKVSSIGNDGVMLNEDQFTEQLKEIISLSPEENPYPLGILTAEHRDTWATIYGKLMKDETNRYSLKQIEQSLIVVCLDKSIVDNGRINLNDKTQRQTMAVAQTIHGGGSAANSYNRWFDKTIQFMSSIDGYNALGNEHSPAEGQPVAVMIDFMFSENIVDPYVKSEKVQPIEKLTFNLTPEIEKAVDTAKENVDKIIDSFLLNCFTFHGFGKGLIKTHRLSPDSFIQMALQSAFYKLHKIPGAQYETAVTRKYIGGRTETIRSCSEESVYFAKVLFDDKITLKSKFEALKNAIRAHKEYTLQAMNGFGVDRHLLGLKLIALEHGMDIPEIFKDAGFQKSSYMRLSTSQVVTKCDAIMGYAPLVPDGYSICYNPHENSINIGIGAFKHKDSNINAFTESLHECLNKMKQILLSSAESKL